MNNFNDEEQSMRTMRGDTKEGTLGRIDQYDIIRKLGGGGFGVVYLVRDTLSNVEYAIKTLHPLLKSNPEEMENLRSQFKLVSKLNHSHIASAMYLHPVKEVVYANDDVRKELRLSPGDFLMVMKYAPGVTLSQWRKQFPNAQVPVDYAIGICSHVAAALDYAHSEKIIHRDVKPSNVMVETREDGTTIARVLDFGLAAEIRSSMSRVSTEKGDTSGTRPYMAPEQWQGKKQGPATDQYALACMFYELVSGAVPFAGVFETGDFQIMFNNVKSELPDPLDELSEEQNTAIQRALSKNPNDRFASCVEFISALQGYEVSQVKQESPKHTSTKTVVCKKCGFENNKTALFCKGCGEKIERDDICLKCGAEIDPNQKHCDKCGAKTPLYIAEEKAEAERKARAEAERRAREAELKARAEAERKAREEAERKARAEAERKAREEAERKAREEAKRKAREEAKRKAKERKEKCLAFFKRYKFVFTVITLLLLLGVLCKNAYEKHQLKQNNSKLLQNAIPNLIDNMVRIPDSANHNGLYFGKYEVTQAQWQSIMGDNPSHFKGDLSRPVEFVSWYGCQEFIKRLNALPEVKQAGLTFFLPMQEEWEYACRAGSTGKYGLLADWREGTLDEMGWYKDNSPALEWLLELIGIEYQTHPVGQKKPNAWGLYDMHGNVWEWTVSANGSLRINRGGCCYGNASYCESGSRYWDNPEDNSSGLGFRLAASRTVY